MKGILNQIAIDVDSAFLALKANDLGELVEILEEIQTLAEDAKDLISEA